MPRRRLLTPLAISLCALAGAACSGTSGAGGTTDRAAVDAHIVRDVVLPAFDRVDGAAATLERSTVDLCTAPDRAHLEQVRSDLAALRSHWSTARTFIFGPPVDQRLSYAIDFWPPRVDKIDAVTTAAGPFDASSLGTLGSDVKGLYAIDQLTGGDELATGTSPRRCQYTMALTAAVHTATTDTARAWHGQVDSYLKNDPRLLLGDIVSSMSHATKMAGDDLLGQPLGTASGGTRDPSKVRGTYTGADVRGLVAGVRAAASGSLDPVAGPTVAGPTKPGLGVAALVAGRSKKAGSDLDARLTAAETATAALPADLRAAIAADDQSPSQAVDALRQLQVALTTQVASQLGVTISFSESDGD